ISTKKNVVSDVLSRSTLTILYSMYPRIIPFLDKAKNEFDEFLFAGVTGNNEAVESGEVENSFREDQYEGDWIILGRDLASGKIPESLPKKNVK
ncbi:hypothetical protein HK096_009673, partial [Nowakowskiella sp. JEL0078]